MSRTRATRSLSQAARPDRVRPDSTQARLAWARRNIGTLAPSHALRARNAKRRSGGFVNTTYAAATAAAPRTTLAAVRALSRVKRVQLRRGPDDDGLLPRICSDDPLRTLSDPPVYDELP